MGGAPERGQPSREAEALRREPWRAGAARGNRAPASDGDGGSGGAKPPG